jgi:SAM-dependent methyltransferase
MEDEMTDATPADSTAGNQAAGNAAQAEAWNGDEGEYFVAERARHERMGQQHTQRLLDAAAITSADAVLDVGCGCGQTTIRAARAARDGHALGVDLSAVMLAQARRQADRDEVRNVSFQRADAQTHQFPAGGFDIAISSFGVMFFADPQAAFANIAAALHPGGRLAFLCWQDIAGNEWLTVPFAAAAAHVTLPELPATDQPGPFSLADPQRIRHLLTQAGFGSISIENVQEERWMGTDIDDVTGYYTAMPFARQLIATSDNHTTTAVMDAIRDALRPYQQQEGVVLQSAAWLITAHRDRRAPTPSR